MLRMMRKEDIKTIYEPRYIRMFHVLYYGDLTSLYAKVGEASSFILNLGFLKPKIKAGHPHGFPSKAARLLNL